MTLVFAKVEPPPDEVVDGVLLARSIIAALPSVPGRAGALRADVLALLVLLKRRAALTVGHVQRDLGMGAAAASQLCTRAENAGLVERRKDPPKRRDGSSQKRSYRDGKDARISVVVLTAKGKQLMRNTRGARRKKR